MKNGHYPVLPDPYDHRDWIYALKQIPLREIVDLRNWAPPVEEQLHLGSCTGQAMAGAYELMINQKYPDKFVNLSRLFIYYNARLLEDCVNEDSGAYIKDVIQAVKQYGICTELIWPYIIENFAITPTINSYEDAQSRTITKYHRVETIAQMLDAINNNYPILFGMKVYESFDDLHYKTTVLPMPTKNDDVLGGHSMCLVGYDLPKRLVLARNSFGPDWCMNGYCWISFDYVEQEFVDMWVFDIKLK
jgi:C1A family cysteine protease